MEQVRATTRIHPLIAGAAASVMLVSLTGVAAMTGLLPTSHGEAKPASAAPTAITGATAPAIATAATSPVALLDANRLVPIESPKVVEAPKASEAPRPKQAAPAASAPQPRPQPVRVAKAPAQEPSYGSTSGAYGGGNAVYGGYGDAAPSRQAQAGQYERAAATCHNCGRVEDVDVVRQPANGSGIGMVAGAVLGGVLGNQVGGGNGKKIATVAGAVGGGYAGNEIEKHTRATTTYNVRVRMEDGSVRSIPYSQEPGWSVGERVRIVNGQIAARG